MPYTKDSLYELEQAHYDALRRYDKMEQFRHSDASINKTILYCIFILYFNFF